MAEGAKKEGIIARAAKGIKATKSELKKVVWPSRSQVINNTGIVIAAIVVFGVILTVLDLGFTQLAKLILSIG